MKWIRRKLLNWTLRHVFKALTEDEILPWDKIPAEKKNLLIAEAQMIKRSDLWHMLITNSKNKAQKRMFEKAESWDDMYFGKALLYTTDLIDKRITAISKLNK